MPLGSGMTEINWHRLSIWILGKLVVSSEFVSTWAHLFFVKPHNHSQFVFLWQRMKSFAFFQTDEAGNIWGTDSWADRECQWVQCCTLIRSCSILSNLLHAYLVQSQPVVRSIQLESIAKRNRVLFVGYTHRKSVQNSLL